MSEFKLIHGRKSIKYNIFEDYDFVDCRAVATRLMGVTALGVTWQNRADSSARLYQLIHLDYSEYGIDEYREFDCSPVQSDYSEVFEEFQNLWTHFLRVMGGDSVDISASCMMRLIESALPLAEEGIRREYDSSELREFRSYAKLRTDFMLDTLKSRGYTSTDCSEREAVAALTPKKLSACETINYFIMRLVDRDFSAASFLSSISKKELEKSDLAHAGIQTLIRCDIDISSKSIDPASDGASFPYRCKITTLARDGYYHSTFIIWLSGNFRSKNPVVTELRTGSIMKLSNFEAAMQVSATEYITTFNCAPGLINVFDLAYIEPFAFSETVPVPNGLLFAAYRKDNSHVDSRHYKLGEDVCGYALISVSDELILMSHDIEYISLLDEAVIYSAYSRFISTKGRYTLDAPVFQTLCQTEGIMFDDLIESGDS